MSLELLDNVNSFISDVDGESDDTGIKVDHKALSVFYNKTFNKILGCDIFSFEENTEEE